jgi:hypothetical protein
MHLAATDALVIPEHQVAAALEAGGLANRADNAGAAAGHALVPDQHVGGRAGGAGGQRVAVQALFRAGHAVARGRVYVVARRADQAGVRVHAAGAVRLAGLAGVCLQVQVQLADQAHSRTPADLAVPGAGRTGPKAEVGADRAVQADRRTRTKLASQGRRARRAPVRVQVHPRQAGRADRGGGRAGQTVRRAGHTAVLLGYEPQGAAEAVVLVADAGCAFWRTGLAAVGSVGLAILDTEVPGSYSTTILNAEARDQPKLHGAEHTDSTITSLAVGGTGLAVGPIDVVCSRTDEAGRRAAGPAVVRAGVAGCGGQLEAYLAGQAVGVGRACAGGAGGVAGITVCPCEAGPALGAQPAGLVAGQAVRVGAGVAGGAGQGEAHLAGPAGVIGCPGTDQAARVACRAGPCRLRVETGEADQAGGQYRALRTVGATDLALLGVGVEVELGGAALALPVFIAVDALGGAGGAGQT